MKTILDITEHTPPSLAELIKTSPDNTFVRQLLMVNLGGRPGDNVNTTDALVEYYRESDNWGTRFTGFVNVVMKEILTTKFATDVIKEVAMEGVKNNMRTYPWQGIRDREWAVFSRNNPSRPAANRRTLPRVELDGGVFYDPGDDRVYIQDIDMRASRNDTEHITCDIRSCAAELSVPRDVFEQGYSYVYDYLREEVEEDVYDWDWEVVDSDIRESDPGNINDLELDVGDLDDALNALYEYLGDDDDDD